IYAGDRQQVAIDFLRAYGCDVMIGGGKDSREVYHSIVHPERLQGLTELWRSGGDAIYDISRRNRSLAHAMTSGDLVQFQPVAYESAALQSYLVALENPIYPAAAFRWSVFSIATIIVDLRFDHIVSVQVSWDKGWSAVVGGRSVPVRS